MIDPADVPHATDLQEPEWELLKYEFKTDLEVYLASVGGEVPRTLADLIAFNAAHADAELAFFGQDVFEEAAAEGPADRAGIHGAAGDVRPAVPGGRPRCRAGRTSARRRRRAIGLARLVDRPRARRSLRGRQHVARRGLRLPQHHGSDGRDLGAPGRDVVHGAGMVGRPPDRRWRSRSNGPQPIASSPTFRTTIAPS